MKSSFPRCLLFGLLLCALPLLADQPAGVEAGGQAPPKGAETPRGMTMRIAQEINLGDLSSTTDYQAKLLPSHNFRIEGTTRLTAVEIDVKLVIVGDDKQVKVLAAMPLGPQAAVVNLERIWKLFPDYSPSSIYDPARYGVMIEKTPEKRSLPDMMLDGVLTKGYELPLPAGRHSLPASLPLNLPDPARVRVWISPEDGIPRRIEFEDDRGNVFLKELYKNVRTGVPLPKSAFDFQFPEGVSPSDMTDMILGGVAGTWLAPANDVRRRPERAPDTPPQEEKEEDDD